MVRTLALGLFAALLAGSTAQAANLCNCCGDGKTEASCATACASVKPAAGLCLPAVDFEGSATIAEGANPLYSVPLQGLVLQSATRQQLESLRELLEAGRRGAETDRKAALRAHRKSEIDATEAGVRAARYDKAIVNYYLGVKAYRAAKSH